MATLLQAPIVTSLRKEVDRFLDRFAEGDLQPVLGRWVPPADLSETDDSLVVEMEIPGFEPTDVHVTLKDQMLTVRGDKKQETERGGKRIVHRECLRTTFMRAIALPTAVDAARATALFRNGMLTITLKKTEEVRGTTIAVQTG